MYSGTNNIAKQLYPNKEIKKKFPNFSYSDCTISVSSLTVQESLRVHGVLKAPCCCYSVPKWCLTLRSHGL